MEEMLDALRTHQQPAGAADPDDEIVQAWDELRERWLRFMANDDHEPDEAYYSLGEKIAETPAHGLRGIAAKTGYALWYAFDVEQLTGFAGTDDDMDWEIYVAARLARNLEQLTGVVVHPTWEMQHDGEECGS